MKAKSTVYLAKEPDKGDKLVKDWKPQLELGLKYRDQYSDVALWPAFRNWYRGNFGDSKPTSVDDIDSYVSRVFSMGKTAVARAYFRRPGLLVTPLRPEFAIHAKVVEAVDNYLINELDLKTEIKFANLQAYLTGIGPIKVGFDSQYGYIPAQAVEANMGTATQLGQKTGERIEYHSNIKPGMPWALATLPDGIITPYGIRDHRNFPWISEAFVRPLADVRQDQKYNDNKKKLKGGFIPEFMTKDFKPLGSTIDNSAQAYCLLYEIRDLAAGKLIVLCEDYTLLEVKDELQIEGLPWEFLIFNPDPEHFWPLSDVKHIIPQQKELNDIRIQQDRSRRFSLLKFLYKKGAIQKEHLDALLSDDLEDIGAGIEIDDDYVQSAIHLLKAGDLTSDLTGHSREIMQDIRETLGYGANQLGEMSPYHNKTAAEATIAEKGSEVRSDERRDATADIISNIVRRWNQYIFSLWTTERVVEIAGPQGTAGWISYTGEQLKGEYALRVDPESGLPVSRALRYQQSVELLKMFNQDPMVDQLRLREQVLRQFEWLDPTAQLLVANQGQGQMIDPMAGFMQQNLKGTTQDKPMELGELQSRAGRKSANLPL